MKNLLNISNSDDDGEGYFIKKGDECLQEALKTAREGKFSKETALYFYLLLCIICILSAIYNRIIDQ